MCQILVVDGDTQDAKATATRLRQMGYVVALALDGRL
jgi:CheY-like chemotaxis protein